VKAYLDEAAQAHSGQTFSDLAGEPGMRLLSPVVEVFFGIDSLSRPRRGRPAVSLSFEKQEVETDTEAAKEEIRRRNLSVLTPQRAVRFIEKHLPAKGARLSTEQLHVLLEDDFLDLLAALAFDRGRAGGSHRLVRWRLHPIRADFGVEPDRIPRDPEADRVVERFTIERIS